MKLIYLLICISVFNIHASELTDAIRSNDISKVKKLIQTKVNLEEVEAGITPLSLSVKENKNEITKLLLEANANPNLRDEKFITPLMLAVCNQNSEIVKLLIKNNADINANTQHETMLVKATRCSNAEIVQILLDSGIDYEKRIRTKLISPRPVVEALKVKKFDIADVLLNFNFDINEGSYNGNLSPLCFFSQNGETEAVSYLIKKKANLNHLAQLNYTPLMFAATENRIEVVKLLIDAGADVNIVSKDDNESTALSLAREKKHEEIIKLLLNAKAK